MTQKLRSPTYKLEILQEEKGFRIFRFGRQITPRVHHIITIFPISSTNIGISLRIIIRIYLIIAKYTTIAKSLKKGHLSQEMILIMASLQL